ncbi:MAG: hypothetical protein FJ303_06565 [Planctomycetes bacterium]|nr:hypothetical protein [Planctomycetota bacterium]
MIRLGLLLALALLTAHPCRGGTDTQRQGIATLEVHFDAATPSITLADLVVVTLTVDVPASMQAPIAPLTLPKSAPWDLIEPASRTREPIEGGKTRYRIVYRFAPRAPAKKAGLFFPEVKLRQDGAEQIITWKPVFFEIGTQVTTPDRAALRDITSIEELPTSPEYDMRWLWWLVGLGAMALIVAAVVLVRVWMYRVRVRTAGQWAILELDRLMARKLPEQGRSERFATLLTLIVRRFLERRYGLPVRRQTTPEFVQYLGSVSHLTASDKQFLIQLFERCDAIKFGLAPLTPVECETLVQAVREFLFRHATEPEA